MKGKTFPLDRIISEAWGMCRKGKTSVVSKRSLNLGLGAHQQC